MLKAIIFDLDGTIGNTLPLCIAAFREAIEPLAGKKLTDGEIIATFGPSEEGTIMQLIPEHYRQGVDDYIRHYERLHDMCPEPFEGMRQVIARLKSGGMTVVMVTGKGGRSCRITLERYGMTGLFDQVETGSPHGQRKAEGIRAVLERFGLKPTEAVYVGDAPSDITASRAVGVPVIAAAWAETADVQILEAMNPDGLFTSVREFAGWVNEKIGKVPVLPITGK
ncbi:MAG: HAD family hydrolase [Rikenellaceae bacterium]|nr:HAD family hydrolase [Rikenellaceae bacterium]